MFARVRSAIILPVAKSVNCLTYILLSTFVTSKEINQAFLHAGKFVINFVSFSCKCTGKTVPGSVVFYKLKEVTELSTGYNLLLTK